MIHFVRSVHSSLQRTNVNVPYKFHQFECLCFILPPTVPDPLLSLPLNVLHTPQSQSVLLFRDLYTTRCYTYVNCYDMYGMWLLKQVSHLKYYTEKKIGVISSVRFYTQNRWQGKYPNPTPTVYNPWGTYKRLTWLLTYLCVGPGFRLTLTILEFHVNGRIHRPPHPEYSQNLGLFGTKLRRKTGGRRPTGTYSQRPRQKSNRTPIIVHRGLHHVLGWPTIRIWRLIRRDAPHVRREELGNLWS